MKLPWPCPFADGDAETWLSEFEAIASCNGIKGDSNLLKALGTLLTGRARAVFLLNKRTKVGNSFAEMKAALLDEFTKAQDRQRAMDTFYAATYDGSADPLMHYKFLRRQLKLGQPSIN